LLASGKSTRDPLSAALTRKAQTDAPGKSEARPIASGEGWRVLDIVCTYGPNDLPFEEHFSTTSISIVLAGNFVCHTSRGISLMAPGAMMLGNAGFPFECSHQHGEGDRCLSFQFERNLFERIAHDAGARRPVLDNDHLPPLRELAPLTVRAALAGEAASRRDSLEEVALELAGAVVSTVSDTSGRTRTNQLGSEWRIARALQQMEAGGEQGVSVVELARRAGLSSYHFLRTFKQTIGVTPHQWLIRTRLRRAAEFLIHSRKPITEIALDVGFDDLSNFIRSFRSEFGVSPRRYRAAGI
jgi:AraC-like DNA-binding protein